MLTRRIISCLDVRDGTVVKGIRFSELAVAGDPGELARRYDAGGIDEVIVLDVSATIDGRLARADTVRRVAAGLFIPLTVGGGIMSLADAKAVFDAGADKVSLNSAALRDPDLVTQLAALYGSQAVVVAIDAKRVEGRYRVFGRSGTAETGRDPIEWAQEAASLGAGEILLTSIDCDGTRAGFDCALTAAVSASVDIPVIASGGAGGREHFLDVFTRGRADAALAASIFHFSEESVGDLKQFLASHGVPVRLTW
jgi:cyclase